MDKKPKEGLFAVGLMFVLLLTTVLYGIEAHSRTITNELFYSYDTENDKYACELIRDDSKVLGLTCYMDNTILFDGLERPLMLDEGGLWYIEDGLSTMVASNSHSIAHHRQSWQQLVDIANE